MQLSRVQTATVDKVKLLAELNAITDALTIRQTQALIVQASTLAHKQNLRYGEKGNPDALSARELEVLVLVASGYSRKCIGESLGISMNTAARHISNIYAKLGISSIAEATCYAYRNHLIANTDNPESEMQKNAPEIRAAT